MRDLLDRLVGEMVDKGIRYEDAQREFARHFISRVIRAADGNLCRAADTLGMHRNTLGRKMHDLKIKRTRPSGDAPEASASADSPGLKSRRSVHDPRAP